MGRNRAAWLDLGIPDFSPSADFQARPRVHSLYERMLCRGMELELIHPLLKPLGLGNGAQHPLGIQGIAAPRSKTADDTKLLLELTI